MGVKLHIKVQTWVRDVPE